MPGLIFLGGPRVVNALGSVTKIINAKEPGSHGMNWSFEQQGGWLAPQRRYTNTLRIFTSNAYVGSVQIQQVMLGQGCFQGATYRFPIAEFNGDPLTVNPTEIDTGSFCQSLNLRQDSEDMRQWAATIEYSSYNLNHELGNSQVQNGSVNPLEMKPKAFWSSAKYQKTLWLDANGEPILNTAGDPLEGGLQVEESRPVLNFVRNEEQYSEIWAQQYRDSVNSDNFLGWSPNQVKCKDIQGRREYVSDYGFFWEVSYEFEMRIGTTTVDVETTAGTFGQPVNTIVSTTGWNFELLSQGFRQKVGGMGDPQQITVGGSLITSPVMLQSDGSYNPDPSAKPYYLYFVGYRSQAFADLNIPPDVFTANQ